MIEACVGLPGTGKSYFATQKCLEYIASGGAVFTNIRFKGVEAVKVSDGSEEPAPLDRYELASDAPFIRVLRRRFDWVYQPGQYHYIDDETIKGNFLEVIPAGTPDKKVLLVLDEVNDNFDSLDRGRLNNDSSYRRLFDFLRLHRHYFIDVLLLLQAFDTLNNRLRQQCQYIWRMTDMQGLRLPGLPIRFPLRLFLWQQFDRTGRTLIRRMTWPKEQCIFDCYDSFQQWNKFQLSPVKLQTNFTGQGKPKREVHKMTNGDRLIVILGFVILGFVFVFFGRPRNGASVAPQVVVVTNYVERASSPSGGPSAAPSGPRVIRGLWEFSEAGEFRWGFFNGDRLDLGAPCEWGTVSDIQKNYVRVDAADGSVVWLMPSNRGPGSTGRPDGESNRDQVETKLSQNQKFNQTLQSLRGKL